MRVASLATLALKHAHNHLAEGRRHRRLRRFRRSPGQVERRSDSRVRNQPLRFSIPPLNCDSLGFQLQVCNELRQRIGRDALSPRAIEHIGPVGNHVGIR